IIEKGTTPEQRDTFCTLESLASTLTEKNIKPPALIVVGEVINARERIVPALAKVATDMNAKES
ncbi:MAG: hypothetical protein U9R28_04380, partial [Pseudomonadota bacterium]|nr:hypothetical protein [Pseudomonadota bacterium]